MREDGTRKVVTAVELWRETGAAANGLRRAGVRPDDVVLLVMGHSRAMITTFLGAIALGAVPALVSNPTARIDLTLYRTRIEGLVRASAAVAVVIHSAESAALRELLYGMDCRVIESDAVAGEPDGSVLSPPAPEQIAFIQFSSGSGGLQKGIVHTHAAVLRYIESKRRDHGLTPDDVIVNWTPLYHDQGLISGLLAPLVIGFRTVLMSPLQWLRQPGLLLQAMHECDGTLCYMPNFALNHCVRAMRERDSEGLDLRRWRLLLLGGEPVRLESLQAFLERFGPQGFRESSFRAGYGMAEMVEGVTASRTGPPSVDWIAVAALQRDGRAVPVVPRTPGSAAFVSCGPPKDGAALRIVDEAGVARPERRVGEIEVRTESMMKEYHGGHNIAPDEIEAVAERVAGVLPGRVVAFGVPDERAGTDRVILVCEAVQPEDAARHGAGARRHARRGAGGGARLDRQDLQRQEGPRRQPREVARPVYRRGARHGPLSMASKQEIVDGLRRFICTELMPHPSYPLRSDEPLMSGGLVDSFCLAHIGVFIEQAWGVYIPDPALTVESMDTLDQIAVRVLRG